MLRLAFIFVLSFSLPAQTPPAKKAAPKTAAAESIPLPEEPGLYAIFNTSMGRIVVKLYEKEAPKTVANFVGLARGTKAWVDPKTKAWVKRPMYNGLQFHRVIKGFMIQTGDPANSSSGNCGVQPIPDEFDPSLKFDQPGRLGMANIGEPNTGSCQFFITDGTPEHLNGKHTIFGQVVEGQDVVSQIASTPRNSEDRPLTPVVIRSLMIRRVGPAPGAPTKAPTAPTKKKS
jgi:cyclophilin family peptidyl-prolyl cis-trans isomerase